MCLQMVHLTLVVLQFLKKMLTIKQLSNKEQIYQSCLVQLATKLAAWLLTKYLTSTAATIQWAEQTGYLPVRQSALDDAGYQAFLDTPTAAQKYVAMAEKAAFEEVDYMYYDPAFVGSSNARDEMNLLVGNILFGGQTPADALSDALWDLQG